MKICGRCGRENPEDQQNCLRCGISLEVANDFSFQAAEPENHCHWHPRTATNLSCGKCERFICPKCAVLSSAGPRCKECARQAIAFRPAAVAHEAKVGVLGLVGQGPYRWWVILALLGAVSGLFRSCGPRPTQIPVEKIERAPLDKEAPDRAQ